MFISLWVHGTAGDVDTPCGEVDIFNISGERIQETILKELVSDKLPSLKMDWFGELPTERALLVEAKDISDEDGLNLEVLDYFEEKIPEINA